MIEKKNTIKTIIFFSFELDINIEKPLTPGDVTYQRTEREKELKQQQQQQQLQQQQQQQQQDVFVHTVKKNVGMKRKQHYVPCK